jgi:hypothetical protein
LPAPVSPLSQGFHFSALENQPGFIFVDNEIIPADFAVLGDYFDVALFQISYISFLIKKVQGSKNCSIGFIG